MLSETIRWMSEPEPPKSGVLVENIIDTVLWAETNDDVSPSSATRLVGALVRTYMSALSLEDELAENDQEIPTVTEGKAEKLYREIAMKTFLKKIPQYDPERAGEVFWWPESLPYKADYPPHLVKRLGVAMGYIEAKRTLALAEYFAEQEKTG